MKPLLQQNSVCPLSSNTKTHFTIVGFCAAITADDDTQRTQKETDKKTANRKRENGEITMASVITKWEKMLVFQANKNNASFFPIRVG
jgi:hypothetical protein